MANFLTKTAAGVLQLVAAISTSNGGSDAGKIIETDANGQIDLSFIPEGVGQDIDTNFTAGANLTSGMYVYVDTTTGEVFPASNTSIATAAVGFIDGNNYTLGDTNVIVQFTGLNTSVSTTVGEVYFLGTNGGILTTPPAFAVGTICQRLGVAVKAGKLHSGIEQPVEYNVQ